MCPNKVTAQVTLDRMKLPHFMKGQGLSCLNLIATVFCCSQIRWIALRVYKLRMGFSVPSIIWVGAEFMQITMQRTRPAWPAKTKPRMTLDCARIAKEIAMMSGLFVESRGQTLLYSWKKKKTRIGKIKTKWIEMHKSLVKICFLRGPLRWLTEQKNPKFLWRLQQRAENNLFEFPAYVMLLILTVSFIYSTALAS